MSANKIPEFREYYPPQPHILPEIPEWPLNRLYSDRTGFVKEVNEHTLTNFHQFQEEEIRSILHKTMYQERIRMKRRPWKVDPPNERLFWKKIENEITKIEAWEDAGNRKNAYLELMNRVIHRYSDEIAGDFREKTFLFARRFLTFFFGRLLNTAASKGIPRIFGTRHRLQERLRVTGYLDQSRQLFDKGIVILVPTHNSNLDSILIGYVLDLMAGMPAFHYGAGLNLYNSEIAAYFMNRLGAYRLDRRKKNKVYMETLFSMSSLSIQKGVNTIFFPGGTRSRSGHTEQNLKLGLLSTCIDAQRALFEQEKEQKVFVVPVVLNYHFVLEAKYLIDEYLKTKGKERYILSRDKSRGIFNNLNFLYKLFASESEIVTSFGHPLDVLGNPVNSEGVSLDNHGDPIDIREYFMRNGIIAKDAQREYIYTQFLGDKIAEGYRKYKVVLNSEIVAFTAFRYLLRKYRDQDLFTILKLPEEEFTIPFNEFHEAVKKIYDQIIDLCERGEVQLSKECEQPLETIIQEGIRRLGLYHARKPLFLKGGEVQSKSFRLLYYYHNRLDIYPLEL